ncbi:class I glutamine amidotransferase-like protein [Clavulina sp. PMI_390]|nr:class I glutamine amidotransferase-like protein [Clavulina sp. PMI_390]
MARAVLADPRWQEYVTKVYPKLQYLLSVCTGSSILARSGLLDGKRATSNKEVFEWVESLSSAVHWIKEARWVVDGKIWTSSGVEAGTDMAHAFVATLYGDSVASQLANILEYTPNTDPSWDPFAAVEYPSVDATSIPGEVVSRDNLPVTRWGVLAFDGAIGLDIAAAACYPEMITVDTPMLGTVSFIGPSPAPVKMASRALNGGQRLSVTRTLSDDMEHLDVLVVPGLPTAGPFPLQSELVACIRAIFPSLKHIMSIGTGSMLLAEAGILNNRKATTSKQLFDSAISLYQKEHAITWTSGRWVKDGNVWTASGSASALDACAALCVEMYGEDAMQQASKYMEYLPRLDASDDTFSKVWSRRA